LTTEPFRLLKQPALPASEYWADVTHSRAVQAIETREEEGNKKTQEPSLTPEPFWLLQRQ
ncbi:MAG: hypothetical protein LJE70_00915, partial [Chromatiaceae bacterium]|nr:hypothetical protein [Chromatiaceae bacterium]